MCFRSLKYNHRSMQPNSTLLEIKHSFNSELSIHYNNPGGSPFPLFGEVELASME